MKRQDNGMETKRVLVAGGGITGLSAAYYLCKLAKDAGIPLAVSVAERGTRWGGKIETERSENFVIEKGPDSFLARKSIVLELSKELGLEGELVGMNPEARKNYILRGKKLHLMPPGLLLGIPTKIVPFLRTGLISPLGKLRAALDLVLPRRKEESDEALGHFLRRRLGKEVAANIAEPLLSGIYAGDADSLSLLATFPQFRDLERKYGSLIKGMMYNRSSAARKAQPAALPPQARNSMFLTYRGGLVMLVDCLVSRLAENGAQLLLGHELKKIARTSAGYRIDFANGEKMEADGVILATPAFAAASLLAECTAASLLLNTPYTSVANVVLVYAEKDVSLPLDGSGFVVPRHEGRHITACTWTSAKWPHTTPDGFTMLRCYVGHSADEHAVHLPDEALLQRVRKDLREVMGITADPLFCRITRWLHAMPQYRVGHLERLKKVRAALDDRMPGVLLAGAGYGGVGIPDCIAQGKEAAERVISHVAHGKT
ncbi:protoporphyrinogen oxidase [Bacillaceae bacterium]